MSGWFSRPRRPEVVVHGVHVTDEEPLDHYLVDLSEKLERIAEALELLCDQMSDVVESLPETDRNMR